MGWSELEPDAGDLGNVAGSRDWFGERVEETQSVGRGLANMLDEVRGRWQGAAAEAWRSGAESIVATLTAALSAYTRAKHALDAYHSGLAALRTEMDEVRSRESAWGQILNDNQKVFGESADWLRDHPDADTTDPDQARTARRKRDDAAYLVQATGKVLAEARSTREQCAATRRRLDADTIAELNGLQNALAQEPTSAVSTGEGMVPATFGLSLVRERLAGMSDQDLLDIFYVRNPDGSFATDGGNGVFKADAGALAALLAGALPQPGDTFPGIAPEAMAALAVLAALPATIERGRQISELLARIPAEQATRLAFLFPGLGNLDGVPFEARYAANKVNIAAAIGPRQERQTGLDKAVEDAKARLDAINSKIRGITEESQAIVLKAQLDQATRELSLAEQAQRANSDTTTNYIDYLTERTPTYEIGPDGQPARDVNGRLASRTGHQILVFSDRGPGAIAEVWGNPATARQVGTAVPGTGINMAGFRNTSKQQAGDLVNNYFDNIPRGARSDGFAMISWAGGEFPQNIPMVPNDGIPNGMNPSQSASDTSYAQELGNRLYRFSDALHLAAPQAQLAVGGHSYGGSVVGVAAHNGMKADRVLFIESAGMGPGVGSANDYPQARTTKYYQMTAPSDPIWLSQGSGVHGQDPTADPAVRALETGFKDTQHPEKGILSGPDAHNGVFTPRSTAWDNIYAFYTDKPMQTKAPSESALTAPGYQPASIDPTKDHPYLEDHSYSQWLNDAAQKIPYSKAAP